MSSLESPADVTFRSRSRSRSRGRGRGADRSVAQTVDRHISRSVPGAIIVAALEGSAGHRG